MSINDKLAAVSPQNGKVGVNKEYSKKDAKEQDDKVGLPIRHR